MQSLTHNYSKHVREHSAGGVMPERYTGVSRRHGAAAAMNR